MHSLLKKAGLGLALAATALTAAAPADAQRWRGGGWRGGGWGGYHGGYRGYNNGAGTAVVAGIAGLAIGAALTSNRNDRYRDDYYRQRGYQPYYDDGYYRSHGYYQNDGYYAYRSQRDWGRCWVERRYDRYYDDYVRVRVCD